MEEAVFGFRIGSIFMRKTYVALALLSISLIGCPEAKATDEIEEDDFLKTIDLFEKENERDIKQLELYKDIIKKDWIQEWIKEASSLLEGLKKTQELSYVLFCAACSIKNEDVTLVFCREEANFKDHIKNMNTFIEILQRVSLLPENFKDLEDLNFILNDYFEKEINEFEEIKKSLVKQVNFLDFSGKQDKQLRKYILSNKEAVIFKEITDFPQETNDKQSEILPKNDIKKQDQRFESMSSICTLLGCLEQVIKGEGNVTLEPVTWETFNTMLSQKKIFLNFGSCSR